MKAYKATYDMTCRDTTFEVGQEYTIDGEISPCSRGFHFCPKMADVLRYYQMTDTRFTLLEIEVTGDVKYESDKGCTNAFKVVRVVDKSEYDMSPTLTELSFRDDGRLAFSKDENGMSRWYDHQHETTMCVTRAINAENQEWINQYDGKNVVFRKDWDGNEETLRYDERGNLTYRKFLDKEIWLTHNDKDRLTSYKDTNGYEEYRTFADDGVTVVDVKHYNPGDPRP